MANDNQNQVLDEQTDLVEEKATKRVRKAKPKALEGGSTASLFGIAPYQPKKNEEYMSEGQLEHFRQILMAWKEEVNVRSRPYTKHHARRKYSLA